MKTHRVRIINGKELLNEIRFCNGLLYRQNRSYDVEISFDDFIARLQKVKKFNKTNGNTVLYDVIDKNVLWNEI
uniref:Uncharacterized protein n=1 Tax=viral metagenome TaxID=1070528 RepID=A0A6M3JN98_9ZZZZ